MVPAELRRRWHLVLGRSQDELPALLELVGEIELFMHDSEHSYECMRFEFASAWSVLRAGGVLIADDVNVNPAWDEFTREVGRTPHALGPKLADDREVTLRSRRQGRPPSFADGAGSVG